MSKSCSGKINKTSYDDPGKPMKQTSFKVKNPGGNLPEKQSTIAKRSFRSSTKPLSIDFTIPIDKLTAEAFYHFRTFELFNIWMPPFWCTNRSTWLTNCADPSTRLNHQLEEDCWLQSSSLHQQWRSRSTWLQNPKTQKHNSFFFRELSIGHLLICSPCILFCDGL